MTGYHDQNGVDVRIARIFNTYGPRTQPDDGRVLTAFVVQALAGTPLTVFGDGSQTRSFCYVDDMVAALAALMECEKGADLHRPVNLGNPEEISILALARKVAALAGSGSPVEFRSLPEDDPVRRCPDIARARALLGWSPAVDLDAGLERTVRWWRENG